MSKHEEADLILKLYDLRREPTMRIARDYFFRDFNPESMADIASVLMSEHSGHIRMVVSYWDMAAALVNHGAIDVKLFNDTNRTSWCFHQNGTISWRNPGRLWPSIPS